MQDQSTKDNSGDEIDISLLKKGDNDEFVRMVKLYSDKLMHKIMYRHSIKKEVALDLVQDIYEKLIINIHKIKDSTHLRNWLYIVLSNCVLDKKKKNNPSFDTFEEGNFYGENEGQYKTHPILINAIENLNPLQKKVIKFKYFYELSDSSISLELGIPKGTVKSNYYRARKKITKEVKQYKDELLEIRGKTDEK